MGRGRQKAKHTKVARDLKYFSPDTNYGALQKELGNGTSSSTSSADAEKWPEYTVPSGDDDQYEDIYADVYGDDEDDDEAEDEGSATQRTA